MALLEIENIHTYYELSHVLFGVSLKVEKNEVTFLLGRNGVGKTTTFRSILGVPAPRSGSIRLNGKELTGLPTHRIARLGISLVPEGRRILAGLSVDENLLIAAKREGRAETWTMDRVYRLFPILKERRKQEAITLSGGEQQMLAIARGLMSNPILLLIDEPVEGLAPLITRAVLNTLIQLKNEGMTMFCVDDDTKLAGHTANFIYFMEQGCVVWGGTPRDALRNDQAVARKYLGVG